MKRKIFDELMKWKKDSARKTALLYVLHTLDLKEEDGITYLSIYMTPFL